MKTWFSSDDTDEERIEKFMYKIREEKSKCNTEDLANEFMSYDKNHNANWKLHQILEVIYMNSYMDSIGDNPVDNSSDKSKIKSKIDNLIDDSVGWDDDYYNGYRFALEEILEFIDNLK